MIRRYLTDPQADRFLVYAFVAWGASIVHPAIGFLLQFPAIIYLTWRCELKTVPALLVLVLGKSNFAFSGLEGQMALRFGITLTGDSCLLITAFFYALRELFSGRCGPGGLVGGLFWLLTFIPGAVMSYQGKKFGLSGAWSGPIMDALIPALYYWGVSMGRTYEAEKDYFYKRLLVVIVGLAFLKMLFVFNVFSFWFTPMLLCTGMYALNQTGLRKQSGFSMVMGVLAILVSFLLTLFWRRMALESAIESDYSAKDLSDADKVGSTFSAMATFACAWMAAVCFRRGVLKPLYSALPVLMVIANLSLVTYVVTTQRGNRQKETVADYSSFIERFQYKLFADRANVWGMGWDETWTPPLIFKDLRQAYVYGRDGMQSISLLPHNQFLTLFGRRGWWLGGYLSLFFIAIWVRACRVLAHNKQDRFLAMVMLPCGIAEFLVVGTTGQSAVAGTLWGDGLATIVFPGIAYGMSLCNRGTKLKITLSQHL